jgi:hypothetical protein
MVVGCVLEYFYYPMPLSIASYYQMDAETKTMEINTTKPPKMVWLFLWEKK